MANDRSKGQTGSEAPTPYPGLKPLDRLVGTWKISGEAEGETTYEWMEGGFFLIARGQLKQGGSEYKHMEIIGFDRGPDATDPASDLTSRVYTTRGETLDYTHEVDDKTVTSWFGPKGSPAVFRAQWGDDGNTLTGAWEWPGGGYKLTLSRV